MNKENHMNHYLQNGLYGTKKFQSAIDKNYLGSFYERCYMALTKRQILQKNYVNETEHFLKTIMDISMLLNGDIPLHAMKFYIELAKKHHKTFTIVQSGLHRESFGLVLAASKAIEQKPKFFYP